MIDFEHKLLSDARGSLVAIESERDVPFEIKRIFYIFGVNADISRGHHAHYKCKQYLIAINGSCEVTLDDGNSKSTYSLHSPQIGLFQDSLVWGSMHNFSQDCVLLVLADHHYDETDYIHDYGKFMNEAKLARVERLKL